MKQFFVEIGCYRYSLVSANFGLLIGAIFELAKPFLEALHSTKR